MKTPIKIVLLSIVAVAFLSVGCSSITPTRMQARSSVIVNHQSYTVAVRATGEYKTTSFWTGNMGSSSLEEAIRRSIESTGVFRSVVPGTGGDYLLEAAIVNEEVPGGGFTMTTTMVINWKLTHVATGKVVFNNTISKSFTATVGDKFAGAARVVMTQEGAARENIEVALHRISQLSLTGQE